MKTPEDEAFEEIERIQRTRTSWVSVKKPQDGMTLRDYFAAKAMQGLFASDTSDWNQEGEWGERARTAYEMADAMMKARETNA